MNGTHDDAGNDALYAFGSCLLPAPAGIFIGGTALFPVLAQRQVHEEPG